MSLGARSLANGALIRPGLTARRRRRWPKVVIVLAVILVAAAGAFLLRYQPLAQGSSEGVGGTGTRLVPSPGSISSDQPVYRVAYRDGKTGKLGLSIRNDGPLGVTVTEVGREGWAPGGLVRYDGTFLTRDVRGLDLQPQNLVPFRPFSLGPGEELPVVIRFRYSNCGGSSAGTAETIVAVSVGFRVLGLTHHASVPLRTGVEVPSPPDSACPGRSTAGP
jgi:hypothetical protein